MVVVVDAMSIPGVDPQFKTCLKTLTEHVFDLNNVAAKEIDGKQVTGREMLEYFKVMISVSASFLKCILRNILIIFLNFF